MFDVWSRVRFIPRFCNYVYSWIYYKLILPNAYFQILFLFDIHTLFRVTYHIFSEFSRFSKFIYIPRKHWKLSLSDNVIKQLLFSVVMKYSNEHPTPRWPHDECNCLISLAFRLKRTQTPQIDTFLSKFDLGTCVMISSMALFLAPHFRSSIINSVSPSVFRPSVTQSSHTFWILAWS